jgi:hypothetical protein
MMRLARTLAALGSVCALMLAATASSGATPGSETSARRVDLAGTPLVNATLKTGCGGRTSQLVVNVRVFAEKTILRTAVQRGGADSRWVLFVVLRRGTDAIPRQVRATASSHGRVVHPFSFHVHGDGLLVSARRTSDDRTCYLYLKDV